MTYLSGVLSGIKTSIGAHSSASSAHKHLGAQEYSLHLGCTVQLQSLLQLLVLTARNLHKTGVYYCGIACAGDRAHDTSAQDSGRSVQQQPEDDLSEVLSVVRALYGGGAYPQVPCSPTTTLETSSPAAHAFQDPRSPRTKDICSW